MIVLAASFAALFVLGSSFAHVCATPGESRATWLTRAMLAGFAAVVGTQAALGALGLLAPDATLVCLAVLAAAAALRARGRRRGQLPARVPWTVLEVGAAGALATALPLRLAGALHRPLFLYDALSYHLHAPVTWMHAHRLEIVPAVFGDPAPAYAPGNLELWFHFLLAPLRSDALAQLGQLPLAALAALAIVAAVREAGGGRAPACLAALAFLLIPEIWQQAATAMVDLGLAAFLLAALPFLFRLGRQRDGARHGFELFAFGTALGLGLGTKYVGAPLALPFLAAGAIALARRRPSARAALRAFGIVAGAATLTGGFWYLRNLVVAGNPFYPVATLGFTGLYDRQSMRTWDYHLPVGELAGLGQLLLGAGVGFAGAAAVGLARAWRAPETPLAVALVALFWLVIPYQESRFLFPALGVAAVALGRLPGTRQAALGWMLLAVAVLAPLLELPTVERLLLLPIGLAAGAAARGWPRVPPALRRTAPALGMVAAAIALAAGLAAGRGRRAPALGDDIDGAWAWFRANVHGTRVAYTGTNLASPLAGAELSNRVTYVNVAGTVGDGLHDFGRRAPGLRATPEPAPYRDGAAYETWRSNLREAGTQVLFVAAMYPIVRRNIAADGDGFPVERAWADAHPDLFHLRYADTAARVYSVAAP